MKLNMILKEAAYRMGHSFFEALAVALAVGAVLASSSFLAAHRAAIDDIVETKRVEQVARMKDLNNDMRKATLKLSFNLYIFPEEASLKDWYLDDTPDYYLPGDYVQRLATSGMVTVRHFLPSLQEKVEWPEERRSIILIGTMGEVPNLFKTPKTPLVQPVPDDHITLGYALHKSLDLKPGDTTELMGRTYTVHECYEERGNKDDITAWIPLKDAQALLNKENQISSILALECLCAGPDALETIRRDIQNILPGTQVIELGTKVLARYEARTKVAQEAAATLKEEEQALKDLQHEREAFLGWVAPGLIVVCVCWIGLLTYQNAVRRRLELSILRVMGFSRRAVGLLLAGRLLLVGAVGLLGGRVIGGLGARWLAQLYAAEELTLETGAGLSAETWVTALATAFLTALVAGWLPLWQAVHSDPASLLQKEE